MGCSYTAPNLMAGVLRTSYRQYIRNPKIYNTVPGQFSEWFDGESLVNRGMRLSPWEPPRFLWTTLEGAFGIKFLPEGFSVLPRIPLDWSWMALRDLPYRGKRYTWFMGRVMNEMVFFTATPFATDYRLQVFDEDITSVVHAAGEHATVLAWRLGTEILIAAGTESERKIPLILELDPGLLTSTRYAATIYRSETGRWYDIEPQDAAHFQHLAVWVEERGFALIRIAESG
jgi:hypothetical protein